MTSVGFQLAEVERLEGGKDRAPVVVLRVEGELDSSDAAEFLTEVGGRDAKIHLVLDLDPLTFCDSAGFAALEGLLSVGNRYIVLGTRSPIRRAARLMGLPTHDSVPSALRALRS